jgi:hypothetical protein
LHDRERDSLEFKIATYRNDLGVGLTLMRRVGTVLRVSAQGDSNDDKSVSARTIE